MLQSATREITKIGLRTVGLMRSGARPARVKRSYTDNDEGEDAVLSPGDQEGNGAGGGGPEDSRKAICQLGKTSRRAAPPHIGRPHSSSTRAIRGEGTESTLTPSPGSCRFRTQQRATQKVRF